MKALRHTIVLVVAGLLAATALSASTVASAAEPASARVTSTAKDGEAAQPRHRLWAAISLSKPDTTVKIANEKRTKRGAKRAAVRKCKRSSAYPGQCFAKAWVRHGCAAVAAKLRFHDSGRVSTRSAAAGFGRRPWQARQNAKRNLPGSGGRILAWVCTHRHG